MEQACPGFAIWGDQPGLAPLYREVVPPGNQQPDREASKGILSGVAVEEGPPAACSVKWRFVGWLLLLMYPDDLEV
jgi:hypothetical protein